VYDVPTTKWLTLISPGCKPGVERGEGFRTLKGFNMKTEHKSGRIYSG
jgi:hypothetical protein